MNCGTDDTPESNDPSDPMGEDPGTLSPVVYFTLEVEDGRDTSNTDDWIIIYTENGNLLDFKPFESSENLSFEALESVLTDQLIITFFSQRSGGGNTLNNFSTYPEITRGSRWILKEPDAVTQTRGNVIGDFDVTITNVPGVVLFNASDAFGGLTGSSSSTNSSTSINLSLFENGGEYLLAILDGNKNSKYTFIDNLKDGDNITLDYNQFTSFNSETTISLPASGEYFSSVFAYEDDQEYRHSGGFHLNKIYTFLNDDVNLNPLPIPFLDRFNRYRTEFIFTTNDYRYSFLEYGNKPEKIEIPENPVMTVENTSISDFRFSTNFSFFYKTGNWRFSSGTLDLDWVSTSWNIISSDTFTGDVGAIPQEILQQYPLINLSEITYSSTRLYLNNTYSNFILQKFIDPNFNPFRISEEVIIFSK